MAKEKWVVMTKKADFDAIAKRFKISPMLARIIRNRDIISPEEVDYYLNGTPERMLHRKHRPARRSYRRLFLFCSYAYNIRRCSERTPETVICYYRSY